MIIDDFTMNIWKDTYANLTAANQTVPVGTPVYETDTGRMKIGVGAAYNSTEYKIGKETKSLANDISSSDVTITLDALPKIGDSYIISWHSGDGTYQLVVNPSGSDAIKSGNTTLDSTAQARFGEGEGSAVLEYVATNVWLITSYYDKGSNSNGEFEKHLYGAVARWIDSTLRTTSVYDATYNSYSYNCGIKTFPIAFKTGTVPKFKPLARVVAGGVFTEGGSINSTSLDLYLVGIYSNHTGYPGYEVTGDWF